MKNNISEKERMQRLVKSFDEKNEVLKESTNTGDNEAILKASERFKELARVDEWITNPKLNSTAAYTGGHGVTVNTIMPNTAEQNVKLYNPNYTYLQASEALIVAVKRTIDSGAPINNLGFYEEVNWNLNNMGFNSMQPLDIKTALKKMINN